MNNILLYILEDASSAPFQPEDFLSKIFGNFWALLINLIALVVLFVLLFFVGYKPLKKYSEKRRDYIEGNIKDAENAKAHYEGIVKQSETIISSAEEEAQQIISKAEENAKKQAYSIIDNAKKEAALEQEKASNNIEQEKQKAREEIRKEIVNVALDASKEILGREINEKDNKEILDGITLDLEKKG